MLITLEIPEPIARHLGDSPGAVARQVLEQAALEGYRSGKLSHFQVRTMMGFDSWAETEQFLRSHGVPLNYTLADLEEDRVNLAKLLGPE